MLTKWTKWGGVNPLKIIFVIAISLISMTSDVEGKSKKSSKRSGSSKSSTKKTSAKKSSSKRSASSKTSAKKSSKRSASSAKSTSTSNSKRASASSKSSVRASAKATATADKTDAVSSSTDTKESSGSACPVGQVLQFDSETKTYYYAKKKTCSIPENAHEESWDSSSSLKKLSWIDASEAVYFECDDEYILKNKECVTAYSVCPLNTGLEKGSSGNKYTNPNTDEECSLPTNSFAKKLTTEEAENLGFEKGYIISCNENYYSAGLENMSEYIAQCVKCPDGTKAPAGAKSLSECVGEKVVLECNEGTKDCDSTTGKSTSCNDGYYLSSDKCVAETGCGEGTKDCDKTTGKSTSCNDGYYLSSDKCVAETGCSAGTKDCDKTTGKSKSCNDGYYLSSDKCVAETGCSAGTKDCDKTTGKSTSCNDGYYLDNGKCAKSLCSASGTYICENGKSKSCNDGYYLSSGSCIECPVGTYRTGKNASSSCIACPSGTTSVKGATSYSQCVVSDDVKNRYLNPKSVVNKTFSVGTASNSGIIALDIGCYKAVGYNNRSSYSYGNSALYFCVNGSAKFIYTFDNSSSMAFSVEGNVDKCFSGITAGGQVKVGYNSSSSRRLPNKYLKSGSLIVNQTGFGNSNGYLIENFSVNNLSSKDRRITLETVIPAEPLYVDDYQNCR